MRSICEIEAQHYQGGKKEKQREITLAETYKDARLAKEGKKVGCVWKKFLLTGDQTGLITQK